MAGPEWSVDRAVRVNSDDSLSWAFGTGTPSAPVPISFSGASATLTVNTSSSPGSTRILQLTSAANQITFSTLAQGTGTLGVITAAFPHSLTSTLPPGVYFYNLLVTNASVNGYYALGNFAVNPSVS